MNLQEAETEAEKMSLKQWDSYIHVTEKTNQKGTYYLTKYYEKKALFYYVKGNRHEH